MDVPTLILLGAAGGALRGLLDAYNRFLDWQSERRAHRQLPVGQESEPPKFQAYFDPVADPIAAVVHSAMGAGTAVLFGTTGQVSGAYAAIVVGISAPVVLTQLGRIQSISGAIDGALRVGTAAGEDAEGSPRAAPPAQRSAPAGAQSRPSVAQPATAGPTQSSSTVHAASTSIDERRLPDCTSPDSPRPDSATGVRPGVGSRDPQSNGRPVDAGGPGGAMNDQGAPRHPRGPAIGEEGASR